MEDGHQAAAVRRTRDEAIAGRLDDVMFAPAIASATLATERRELLAKATAPVWKLIAEDEAAAHAARTLIEQVGRDIESYKPTRSIRSGGTAPSLELPPGASYLVPPYDYQQEGPTRGERASVDADPATGVLAITVYGRDDDAGALAGSAAVGLGIESSKGGTVKVRPYVEYDFDYLVYGLGLSATSRGHVGFFVEEKGGPVVSDTQEYVAWDQTSQTSSIGGEAGVLRPPYAEVRFLAEAGRRYQIWIWATVSGDQSGRPGALGIVYSFMYGHIQVRVPFVTVQVE